METGAARQKAIEQRAWVGDLSRSMRSHGENQRTRGALRAWSEGVLRAVCVGARCSVKPGASRLLASGFERVAGHGSPGQRVGVRRVCSRSRAAPVCPVWPGVGYTGHRINVALFPGGVRRCTMSRADVQSTRRCRLSANRAGLMTCARAWTDRVSAGTPEGVENGLANGAPPAKCMCMHVRAAQQAGPGVGNMT